MPFTPPKKLQEEIKKQQRTAEEADAERRATQNNLPYINLISTKAPTEIKAMMLIKKNDAEGALLSPLQIIKNKIVVAVFDPNLESTKKIIETLKKRYEVVIFICSKTSLEHAWNYYDYVTEEAKEISGKIAIDDKHLKDLQIQIKSLENLSQFIKEFKSPYTSQILEIILAGAMALKASDIHLEPSDKKNTLRLRIDGLLHIIYEEFPKIIYESLITRIKLLSSLKLNIHDQPQDGRFTIDLEDRDIEIRTSVIPSEYGETIVMRLLDPTALKANLEELGWRNDDLEIIKKEIQKPNGLILNTGPTGSGKTTTLYAFLRYLSKPEIKIITIEDPIEYHLPGISQTQVNSDANYNFASGLRSILRQDPDIVLVGEIRDKETADIALNASLTGHLVLSTLHTNDAVGAIPRLIDLGAKTQVLGPSLSLIIAQRLVRVLCSECKKEKKIDEKTETNIKNFLNSLPPKVDKKDFNNFKIFENSGCDKCAHLGYHGRISIFELFVVNEIIEQLIYKNPTEIELKESSKKQGMITMQEDGLLKVLKGVTSLAEIERLTGPIQWSH